MANHGCQARRRVRRGRPGRDTPTRPPREFLDQLERLGGVDTEIIRLSDYHLEPCRGCKVCFSSGERRDVEVAGDRLAYGHGRICFPVTSCSVYSDRRQPALRDMEDIAWILRSDPRRREIGFVRPADLRPRERWTLSDDE